MSRRRPSIPRRSSRARSVAAVWGVSLFLVLTGVTASQAYWTTPVTTLAPTATGGSVESTQSGFASLAATFTKTSRAVTTPVVVTNTGSLTSTWNYSFAAPNSIALTNAAFTVWDVASAASCTASAAPVSPAVTTGAVPATRTGQLAAGAAARFCVRIEMSAADQRAAGSSRIDLTGRLVSNVGSWTGGGEATAAVGVVDDDAPTAPIVTTDRVSGYSARLTWPASTDNVGVTQYVVYRGTTLMATLDGSARTWTDASLGGNTNYSFSVEARDAAGNATRSTAATVRTLNINSNAVYRLYAAYANRCVDVAGINPALGTELYIWECLSANNQRFAFRPTGDGSYVLEPQHSTNTAVGVANNDWGTQLRLMTKTSTGTRWIAVPSGNGFTFINDTSGLYLDVWGGGTSNGTAVTQWGPTGGSNQVFSLINP